jgi:WD40 repeat protein
MTVDLVLEQPEKIVTLYDLATGKELRAFQGQRFAAAESIHFSPDGKTLATTGGRNAVHLWDVGTGKETHVAGAEDVEITALACAPDGRVLALARRDRTIRLVEVATGKEFHRLQGLEEPARSLAFCPNGKGLAAAAFKSDSLQVWDPSTGKQLRRLSGGGQVAYTPDGALLCRGEGGRIWLFDSSGRRVRGIGTPIDKGQPSHAPVFVLSADGKTVAATDGTDTLQLWEAATGKERSRLPFPDRAAMLAFSPDGRTLASGGPQDLLRVWDLAAGKDKVLPLPLPPRFDPLEDKLGPDALAYSPTSALLASADGKVVRLWDPRTGRELSNFRGHQETVTALAFAPDGKTLFSASADTTVLCWDTAARLRPVPRQEKPWRSNPPCSLLEARLVAGKATYALDTNPVRELQASRVDLTLELCNRSKQEVKIRVRKGTAGLVLNMRGSHGYGASTDRSGNEEEPATEVKLAPGMSHTIPLTHLSYPEKAGLTRYRWTEAGDYWLTAEYELAVSPAPKGARNAGFGFGMLRLKTNEVKLTVQKAAD